MTRAGQLDPDIDGHDPEDDACMCRICMFTRILVRRAQIAGATA